MLKLLAQHSGIQLASRGASLLLGLIIVALTTRALGPAGYGQYAAAIGFLQFIGLLVGFGLSLTLSRELGKQSIPEATLVSNALSFRVVTASVAFALAPLAAVLLGYTPELVRLITLGSLGLWAASLSQSLGGIFQAKLASSRVATVELVGRFLLLAGTWWAVQTQVPLTTYLIVFTLANLVSCGVALALAHSLISFTWQLQPHIWRLIWIATWPIAVTTTLNVIYFKVDTVVLSLVRPAAEVGIYTAAYGILEVLLTLPGVVGGLLVPLIAKSYTANERGAAAKLYQATSDILLASGLAVVTGAFFMGRPIMTLLAGTNFATSGDVLAILSIAILCSFIGNAASYTLFALDYQKKLIPVFALGALLAIVLYPILIPRYSYWGAAWATVMIEFVVNGALVAVLWKRGMELNFTRWPKIILATLVLAIGLMLPLPFMAKLISGIILWIAALWFLKLIPRTTTLGVDAKT